MNLSLDSLETWARKRYFLRAFGAPLLVALLITGVCLLVADLRAAGTLFGYGFVIGIVLAVLNAITGFPRIRLGLQMIFMVVFYGCIVTLPFIVAAGPVG